MKVVKKQSQPEFLKIGLGIIVSIALIIFFLLAIQPDLSYLLSQNIFLRSAFSNFSDDPLTALIIDMSFDEYNRILNQREEALTKGVVIASNEDFVQADIRYKGETIPVELRLQQGIAEHLGDEDKWNFDGRTRNGQLISGMQRFYLIDPEDNNWLNEVALAEALKNEGLIAGGYQFVRLFLNGEDKGIHALQEGFGQEIIKGSMAEEGVIVEFDSTPLWHAIAHYEGDLSAVAEDPISNLSVSEFQYFQVDTFRDAAIAEDRQLTNQKNQAIRLLRGLQSGELKAGDVFDVEKYGRFLALVDLWGATDATSLVNLRYYFNPQTERLEPIAFNGNPLSSDHRLDLKATYGDFALQESYIAALSRMSNPEYISQLQAEINPRLRADQRALSSEIDVQMPWPTLEDRQEEIRRSLTPLQPVLAFLGSPNLTQEGIIQIDVANALNVPVQILGFNIDGATFLALEKEWVQNDPGNVIFDESEGIYLSAPNDDGANPIRYVRIHIPLSAIISQDSELDFMSELDIQIATRIAGLEEVRLVSAQPGYPDSVLIPTDAAGDE